MTDQTNAALGSLTQTLANIAKNDLLKGLVPVLDLFLQNLQNNQGGLPGQMALANALPSALLAALPNVEAAGIKDSAAAAETSLDAAAAQAESTPVTVAPPATAG
jgi:hypothetical protein